MGCAACRDIRCARENSPFCLANQVFSLRAQLAEVTDKLAAAGRETVEALNRLMVAERERDRYLTERNIAQAKLASVGTTCMCIDEPEVNFYDPRACVVHAYDSGLRDGAKAADARAQAAEKRFSECITLEYVRGVWTLDGFGDGEEPEAVITYATEPSPETGHVGWCWWAQGRMGDAPTLREAMAKAQAALAAAKLGVAK